MSTNSTAISYQPSHGTLNQHCSTTLSWDDGKEIRIYHLGPGNILHEYAYSASKGSNCWYYGDLHDLKIVLDPTSRLGAIRYLKGTIGLYYQDPNNDMVRALVQSKFTKQWLRGLTTNILAVKGSSIAVAGSLNADGVHDVLHLFCQDRKLHLKEYSLDYSGAKGWVLGDFNPGVQPRGTPISAEVVRGGDVDLNVMWRDAHGRAVSSSWSERSGWDLRDRPNDGRELLDGHD